MSNAENEYNAEVRDKVFHIVADWRDNLKTDNQAIVAVGEVVGVRKVQHYA
jgi:hypothetical protein